MPTQQQKMPPPQQDHQEVQRVNTAIGKHVLQILGQPRDLYTVQVRKLWEDRYRVNVFVGLDVVTARVAHSFFLVVDSEDKVVTSTPRITKHYESAQ